MKQITAARSLELAAKAWRPGVKMQTIIVDGWSRGFHKQQTLHECIQAGYSKCIAEPAIDLRWAQIDAEYAKVESSCSSINWEAEGSQLPCTEQHLTQDALSQDKRSAADKAEAIQRYEAYWNKDLTRLHHHVPCPNPNCKDSLRINRPPKRSGDMWDSLATCPYCNGTFFYESRYGRIDMAFKGFL